MSTTNYSLEINNVINRNTIRMKRKIHGYYKEDKSKRRGMWT